MTAAPRKRISLRISASLYRAVVATARDLGLSVNAVIVATLAGQLLPEKPK